MVIRVVFLAGFFGGIGGHIMEYKSYVLHGVNKVAFPISPFRRREGQPLWQFIPLVLITSYILAFGPFLSVAYEFWRFTNAHPGWNPMTTAQLVSLFSFGALISILGFVSIDRDSLIPGTLQWHTEHIILHGSMALYMLGLGGVFMEYPWERFTTEVWGISALTILLLILIIQRDTNRRALASAAKKEMKDT